MDHDGPRGRESLLELRDLLAAADRAIEANDRTAARDLLERAGATLRASSPPPSAEPSRDAEALTTLTELRALLAAIDRSVEGTAQADLGELLELLRSALRVSRPPPAADPNESPPRASGFRSPGFIKGAK